MSTKPMLFSTPMVQAILDGRKTMTRRVIKPQTVTHNTPGGMMVESLDDFMRRNKKDFELLAACSAPYQPGDILWVREAWQQHYDGTFVYKASAPPNRGWRPSIHMPRVAARIFLRVKDVRVEKLQDITLKDIEQEGLYCDPEYADPTRTCHYAYEPGMRIHFTKLWDSLYAKRGFGWDVNPWVWVYSFERLGKPAGWPGGEDGE